MPCAQWPQSFLSKIVYKKKSPHMPKIDYGPITVSTQHFKHLRFKLFLTPTHNSANETDRNSNSISISYEP